MNRATNELLNLMMLGVSCNGQADPTKPFFEYPRGLVVLPCAIPMHEDYFKAVDKTVAEYFKEKEAGGPSAPIGWLL